MPLCERLRLDAGRSFTQTLVVRVYVALVLLAVVFVVTNKHSNFNNTDIMFGSNSTTGIKISDVNINPSKGIMLAKVESSQNATYGR